APTVTVTGAGFVSGAKVCINYPTGLICYSPVFISSTQLSVNISTSGAAPGPYAFDVLDPPPAGTSAPFNFTVTGPPDFSVSSSGTTTQTVAAGQTGTFTNAVSIAAQNGFSWQINLSCSLPTAAK